MFLAQLSYISIIFHRPGGIWVGNLMGDYGTFLKQQNSLGFQSSGIATFASAKPSAKVIYQHQLSNINSPKSALIAHT